MAVKKTDVVLNAMRSLHDAGQVVTSKALKDLTGLSPEAISARMSYLVDNGAAYRIQDGVFVPAHEHKPTRVISTTYLPDGTVSIEVGDDQVVQLNPQEHRILGVALAGGAMQHTNIEAGHALTQTLGEIKADLKKALS